VEAEEIKWLWYPYIPYSMGRPQGLYSEEQKKEVKHAYRGSKDTKEQRRLLCLRLRIERGYPAAQIADIADCSVGLVKKVIGDYCREGISGILRGTCGGNHRNLSNGEEMALLAPFLEEAESGQIRIVSEIHKAYETAVGHAVPPSTVYRMLARHKWRKVMPRPRHPKADAEEQEAYKKNQ
jgi:transposase